MGDVGIFAGSGLGLGLEARRGAGGEGGFGGDVEGMAHRGANDASRVDHDRGRICRVGTARRVG